MYAWNAKQANFLVILEAPPGFEPGMEVLQTSALPLGDGAARDYRLCRESPAASMRRSNNIPRLRSGCPERQSKGNSARECRCRASSVSTRSTFARPATVDNLRVACPT